MVLLLFRRTGRGVFFLGFRAILKLFFKLLNALIQFLDLFAKLRYLSTQFFFFRKFILQCPNFILFIVNLPLLVLKLPLHFVALALLSLVPLLVKTGVAKLALQSGDLELK